MPSGHGCPRRHAYVSRILTALTEVLGRDIRANDPRMSAGCPSQKLPLWADFSFLKFVPLNQHSRIMAPWTFAWICCPQLPYHPCENGRHDTSFCKETRGHTPNFHSKKHKSESNRSQAQLKKIDSESPIRIATCQCSKLLCHDLVVARLESHHSRSPDFDSESPIRCH